MSTSSRRLLLALAVIAVSVGMAGPAWADERDYLECYPYATARKGETEIEFWNDWFQGNPRHQVEIEYGITDRFQAGLYAVWRNDGEGGGTRFAGNKLELRYRLAPYRTFIVDPAVYFEYARRVGGPDSIESKLILSRDIGALNITANLNFERELRTGAPWEFEYVIAVSHPLSKSVTAGLEYVAKPVDKTAAIIPGLYMNLGSKTRLNVGISIATRPTRSPINLRSVVTWDL